MNKLEICFDKKKKVFSINILGIKLKVRFNFSKKLIKYFGFLFKYLDFVIPKSKKKIVFYLFPKFENNVLTFYRYLKENHNDEFDFYFITPEQDKEYNLSNCTFLRTFTSLFRMYSSKYVVTTHDSQFLDFFLSKRHIYLNLWHGMPIKTLGYAEKQLSNTLSTRFEFLSNNSYFFVTSDLFKISMISCFKSDYLKTYITGQPRTDIIASKENENKIETIFSFSNYKKVVLYLPTWKSRSHLRKEQVTKSFNNIFYFDDYDENTFIKMLEDNQILFIMKPHPVEEKFYKENMNVFPNSKNFRFIFDEELQINKFDLYETFNKVDLLISDFSAVTVDWLILNKPIIYLNNLTEDYSKGRGLVLEDNFEILMPGRKAKTFNELSKEIIDNLEKDIYKEQREKTLPLLHKYRDFNASKRVYEVMKKL